MILQNSNGFVCLYNDYFINLKNKYEYTDVNTPAFPGPVIMPTGKLYHIIAGQTPSTGNTVEKADEAALRLPTHRHGNAEKVDGGIIKGEVDHTLSEFENCQLTDMVLREKELR